MMSTSKDDLGKAGDEGRKSLTIFEAFREGSKGVSGSTDVEAMKNNTAQNAGQSHPYEGHAEQNLEGIAGDKAVDDMVLPTTVEPSIVKASFSDIFRQFVVLGWTAFGGPAAHIAMFHAIFVVKLRWMTDNVFAELLALGSCLPGPTSTQMSFVIGTTKRGIPGGLLSGMLFQYPGLIIMTLAGLGAAKWLEHPAGWLRGGSAGITAVAVALVAEAAQLLGAKMCVDLTTTFLCGMTAGITLYYQSQWLFPAVIFFGGLVTLFMRRKVDVRPKSANEDTVERLGTGMIGGACILAFWLALLIGSIIGTRLTTYAEARFLHWFESFYVTGSVIFGGGQVVLPIIEHEVVKTSKICTPQSITNTTKVCQLVERSDTWVTQQQFLAGLGLAQALPGPLFNFAAYLGAVVGGIPGVAACWLGMFSPGILLVFGLLPFWGRFRKWAIYRRMLPGLNAAAVGLIWSSVFSLGLSSYKISPFPLASVVIGIWGFCATVYFKVPAPVGVLGGGVLGVIAWATGCK